MKRAFLTDIAQDAWREAQAGAAEMIERGCEIDDASAYLQSRAESITGTDAAILRRRARAAGNEFVYRILEELEAA